MDNDKADHRVIVDRHVFPFGDVIPPSVDASVTSVINVPGTIANIADWMAEQDKIHAESRTILGNERLPISWPRLPKPLDWNALPAAPTGVVDDELISETIVAAHWMADLAQAWHAIETLRLSRAHLRGGDFETRILPFALDERVPA